MKDVASGIYFVEVRERDDPDDPAPARLWVAALPHAEAVEAVRALVPEGYHVALARHYPDRETAAGLNLQYGDVRELVEPA
ncbi:hypothetical protein [Methylobacterium aquaticum]|uniref:Uncharacterized protein n=1 Tax=Methylobacterium aquaticum TaxID=270351 RepID=A0A0C6FTG1_9HYPH|nr:hypothetical protein [Methylobacterium aquaticum]BAQ50382.1 hypothetical protein Maq22A_4p60130 [Methylobacterium aquaticum]